MCVISVCARTCYLLCPLTSSTIITLSPSLLHLMKCVAPWLTKPIPKQTCKHVDDDKGVEIKLELKSLVAQAGFLLHGLKRQNSRLFVFLFFHPSPNGTNCIRNIKNIIQTSIKSDFVNSECSLVLFSR